MLASAPVCALGGSNGDEIVVGHGPDIGRTESNQRLRPARRRDEFGPERIGAVDFDDGAQIALAQAVSREVSIQDNDIKRMDRHFDPPG